MILTARPHNAVASAMLSGLGAVCYAGDANAGPAPAGVPFCSAPTLTVEPTIAAALQQVARAATSTPAPTPNARVQQGVTLARPVMPQTTPATVTPPQAGVVPSSTVASGACQYQVAGITPDPGIPFCGAGGYQMTSAQIAAVNAAQQAGGYTNTSEPGGYQGAFASNASSNPLVPQYTPAPQTTVTPASAPTDTTTQYTTQDGNSTVTPAASGSTTATTATGDASLFNLSETDWLLLIGGAALLFLFARGRK